MQKRYVVSLTDQQRAGLEGVVRGRGALGKRQRAQRLLKADEGPRFCKPAARVSDQLDDAAGRGIAGARLGHERSRRRLPTEE